ncbi:hypothetical protein AGMMS49545_21070 [Betaproteobacteria bacterium]|nr:hypothetical protein AGMMS49545_21070 [Betaproteobacteria bacterium]GHU48393.1 hypothetical protein AGMMS50289_24950 [Betaproteobacteria bacterium]
MRLLNLKTWASQPLGYWNCKKPDASKNSEKDYYYVNNADFREWRKKYGNGKGGDFLVFSGIKIIKNEDGTYVTDTFEFYHNEEAVIMKKALKIVLLTPLFLLLALILIVVCLDIWGTYFRIPSAEEKGRWTSESPDGRFKVTGHSTKSLFEKLTPTMPGDGGFGPGIVILVDKKTGKILQQARVDNIDSASYVDWKVGDPDALWRKGWATFAGLKEPWEGDYVDIKFGDTWPLPSEDGKLPPPLPVVTFVK